LTRYRFYRLIADDSQLCSFVRERAAGAVKGLLVLLRGGESAAPAENPAPDTKLYFEKGHWHLAPLAAGALSEALAGWVVPLLSEGRCGSRL
jgi:hypothetical protein